MDNRVESVYKIAVDLRNFPIKIINLKVRNFSD